MGRSATTIKLNDEERETLNQWPRRPKTVQSLAQRARIILACAEGHNSLWLKIFGESRVISLITKFAESTATYLYRNFTAEGRLTAIPQKVEVIDSMLKKTLSSHQLFLPNA